MNQPKILFLLYYFPPIKSISVNRNWGIVRELMPFFTSVFVSTTKNGHLFLQEPQNTEGVKIQSITTFDYRTLTALFNPNRSEIHHSEGSKSNPLVRLTMRLLDSFPFNLLFHEGGILYSIISFWQAAKLIRREKITHIYSSFRPMSDHFTAHLLKIFFPKLVWIADFRDLHVDPLYQMPIGKSFQLWCTRRLLSRANLVTTISEGLATYLRQLHPHVYVLRNGVNLPNHEKQSILNSQFSIQNKFTIAYTGSMFIDERNPSLLLNILRGLKQSKIITPNNFQIVYAGKDTAVWQDWVNRYELADYFYSHGLVSSVDAKQIQQTAHINLLLTSALPNYGGVLTGKFYEYLTASQPILVLINGSQDIEFEHIISDLNAGLVAYNDRSEIALRDFVLTLFNTWQQHGDVPQTIRKDKLDALSWTTVGKNFIEKLHSIHS
jgi:hypothetical protein